MTYQVYVSTCEPTPDQVRVWRRVAYDYEASELMELIVIMRRSFPRIALKFNRVQHNGVSGKDKARTINDQPNGEHHV